VADDASLSVDDTAASRPDAQLTVPFDGLTPTTDPAAAAWVVEPMTGRGGIDLVVPDSFEAYLHIHHRLSTGGTWRDLAPEFLQRGIEMYDYPGTKSEVFDPAGNLDADDVDALVPMLSAATTTPADCHYACGTDGAGCTLPRRSCGPLTQKVSERRTEHMTKRWRRSGRLRLPAPWSRGGSAAT
jgi:hypothetical protein